MQTTKNNKGQTFKPIGSDFFESLGEGSWTYIKTVVDIVRGPILILDKELRVMAANEPFYKMFQVEPKDTENKAVYELGNGQWDIPALRKLLQDILPKNTFLKGFEVAHEFPLVGRKVIILNARQIHFKEGIVSELFPPIILLAMEDVTEMMAVAETIASNDWARVRSNQLETKLTEQTRKLEIHIVRLEKEINELKTGRVSKIS